MNIKEIHSLTRQTTGNPVVLKLNQQLTGIVQRDNLSGSFLISVAGRSFSPPANMPLAAGMKLTLKVSSLLPQPTLQIISTEIKEAPAPKQTSSTSLPSSQLLQSSGFTEKISTALKEAPVPKQASTPLLSSQLLQSSGITEKSNISGLLSFYKSLSTPALKALPGEAAAILKTLSSKPLKLGNLANTTKLKSAISHSGLFLESKLSTPAPLSPSVPGTDFKALLFQLFKSLDSLKQSPSLRSYVQNSQNNATGELDPERIRALLKSRVEGALSKISSNQMETVEEFNKGNQRWVFELPVNTGEQIVSIPMTIYRNSASDHDDSTTQAADSNDDDQWCAEFSLDLTHSGQIKVHINIDDMSAVISMHSELSSTADALTERIDELRTNFSAGGLTLNEFNSLT